MEQIDLLAKFIMEEVPGELSESEGAGNTAVRIIRYLRIALADMELNHGRTIRIGEPYYCPCTACTRARFILKGFS